MLAEERMSGVNLAGLGRALFAAAMVCFGLHYVLFAVGADVPAPGAPWFPANSGLACAAGGVLVLAGAALFARPLSRWAAVVLFALFFRVGMMYLPAMVRDIHKPDAWTSMAELLAISGGACALGYAAWPASGWHRARWVRVLARWLFALPMLVFGVQHFLYAKYVGSLVPGWVPWRLFWAYFFGVAMIAGGVAILGGWLGRLAAVLLAYMFLLWLITLHIPLIVAAPHSGDLWTSAFVPMALAGAAFAVAAMFSKQQKPRRSEALV